MFIEADALQELLDQMLVDELENLQDYGDEFGAETLQDPRKMQPFDAYLYGVAQGKRDMIEYISLMLSSRKESLAYD